MKKNLKITFTALCIAALVSGCGAKGGDDKGGRPDGSMMGQETQGSATAVETQEISYDSIGDEYMYTGTIAPSDEVSVNSTLSGKVATVNFSVGDTVNKGDVLFTMDTTDILNSINISQASVNSAQATVNSAQTSLNYANGSSIQTQIENAKNSITSAEDDLKSAENQISSEELNLQTAENTMNTEKINLDTAKKDYDTYLELYNAGGISKEAMDNYETAYTKAQTSYDNAVLSYEKAQNSYADAQLNYEKAEKSLEQAQTNYDIIVNQTTKENLDKAQDSLEQAQASKASAEAQLKSSQQNLTDATVTSPISGTVLECNVTAGTSLSNGTTPFVIIDLDTVTIKINVSEQMISTVNKGDAVKIKVSALSDETFDGSVTTVAPGANSDGTYTVEIDIPNPTGELKSGMFAEAYFIKEKSENTFVIPRSAVITKNDENYVFIVENDTAKKVIVETGIDNGDKIEITSGLNIGDKVVIKGQTYLTDGDAVIDVTNGVPEEEEQPLANDEASKDTDDGDKEEPSDNAPVQKEGK